MHHKMNDTDHSPRSDVLRSLGKRPLMDIHHLPAVASHLHVVADQGEEGSQWQGSGEQRLEPEANHHLRVVSQTGIHQIVLPKRIKISEQNRNILYLYIKASIHSPAPTRTPLPVWKYCLHSFLCRCDTCTCTSDRESAAQVRFRLPPERYTA